MFLQFITTYSVQAYEYNDVATQFWTDLAARGNGKHLNLTQFESIVDIMMGICYREQGPDMFEVSIIYVPCQRC